MIIKWTISPVNGALTLDSSISLDSPGSGNEAANKILITEDYIYMVNSYNDMF